MEKIARQTVDLTEENIARVAELFPNVVTEVAGDDGETRRAIDFDALREQLGDVAEGARERYQFTWPGKRAARAEARRPCDKTFRPQREKSKDWDTTQNLYIEGDNLEALKLLRNTYAGKIKMIYIDPPYNTGHDFVYNDSFSKSAQEEREGSGAFDAEGNLLDAIYLENKESNGRFHSDWCSMMYPRLLLARDLLSEDGVIFVSIDDSEQPNLRKLCNDIYNEKNFIAQFIWQNKKGGGNDSVHVATEHEYILAYARCKTALGAFYQSYSDEYSKRYKEEDEQGRFYWDTFRRKSGKQYYPIVCPDGTVLEYDEDGNRISWLRSEARYKSDLALGEIRFVPSLRDAWSVQFKQRMPQGKKPRSIFTTPYIVDNRGTTSSGSAALYNLFKQDVFSNPGL